MNIIETCLSGGYSNDWDITHIWIVTVKTFYPVKNKTRVLVGIKAWQEVGT